MTLDSIIRDLHFRVLGELPAKCAQVHAARVCASEHEVFTLRDHFFCADTGFEHTALVGV